MMPQSAQNLYFHLGMNADDDGFCEHFTIMRMTESKPDDLKILQAKQFVHVFDEKVLIIRDWKENNYIRSDRYSESKYLEEYKKEIKLLSEGSGIPMVDQRDTQVRLGKDSIGKVSIGKDSISKDNDFSNHCTVKTEFKGNTEIGKFCLQMKYHQWCEDDKKFCLGIFNVLKKSLNQYKGQPDYYGIFNNQLKQFMEGEAYKLMKAEYSKVGVLGGMG